MTGAIPKTQTVKNMTVKERLKADKKTLATLDKAAKRQFIWDYYKMPITAALVIVILAACAIVSLTTQQKTALYAVFVNTDVTDEVRDTEIFDAMLEQGGINMNRRKVDVTADLYLGQEYNSMYDGQTIQVLASLFGISGLDVFAADKEVFDRYASQDAFADLAILVDKELLEEYSDDLYYYENSDGKTILGGIILHSGSVLHQTGYYHGDVIIGAAVKAQNLEEAIVFIHEVLRNK